MGGYSEPAVRTDVQDTEAFKDVDLMLFDKVIAFDNFRQKIILIVNMSLEDPETGYNKAVLELKQLRELLRTGEQKQEEPGRLLSRDRACRPVSLPRGRRRHPPGVPENYCPHRGRRGDGRTAP